MKHVNFFTLLLMIIFTFSCKKKESVPEELTFTTLLNDSNYRTSVTQTAGSWYEYGIKFKSNINGKINKLGSKLPKAGTYRVTVWDSEKKIIAETKINQKTDNIFEFQSIKTISIEKDKEYFISILSNNWNDLQHNTSFRIPYPIVVNNISIIQFAYIGQENANSPSKYPTFIDNTTSISGFIDFSFIPSTN